MKIYFAGSIRGGRADRENYLKIIKYLQKYGKVLTEHVGEHSISNKGEVRLSETEIYNRDISWLSMADVVVAEVSNPSLGVGYEIARAEIMNKDILCLYKVKKDKSLSAMIAGSASVKIEKYNKIEEALLSVDKFFKKIQNEKNSF